MARFLVLSESIFEQYSHDTLEKAVYKAEEIAKGNPGTVYVIAQVSSIVDKIKAVEKISHTIERPNGN